MIDPSSYDWTSFSLTFYYDAHITRVFKTWTEPKGLESFFIERCLFTNERGETRDNEEPAQAGDQYEWQFRQDFSVSGVVSVLEDKKQFSFSFGQMQVDVYFRVLDDKTEVQLVQSEIPDNPDGRVFGHLNCRSCWLFFMTNLTSVLNYGKDLRDENPELVSSMEVGYVPMTQR